MHFLLLDRKFLDHNLIIFFRKFLFLFSFIDGKEPLLALFCDGKSTTRVLIASILASILAHCSSQLETAYLDLENKNHHLRSIFCDDARMITKMNLNMFIKYKLTISKNIHRTLIIYEDLFLNQDFI